MIFNGFSSLFVLIKGLDIQYAIFLILVLCVSTSSAEILFYDDFERQAIDLTNWTPRVSWGIKDNDTRHDVLDRKVLDIWGGGAGLNLINFPEEFDYYADFNARNGGSLGIRFPREERQALLHARDLNRWLQVRTTTHRMAYKP